ncbi:Spy/CpxP family protein refolding chaperone [Propionivibrio limicola]|uniref:Spy/CpxP family protein refolding chaperone n=1 Tax=Propionivibrio limicola TaxID=167645 RepID=UPI001291A852|nr:periplasmic heavy metal sensor [Propionivibrio limicola]
MKQRFSPRLLVAALAMSLGLAANSFAGPRGGSGGEAVGPGFDRPGHHQMFLGGKGMQRLHDDLKLDARQETLWKAAESFAKETHDGMRERFRKHHEEMKALIDKPNADLRALAKRADDFRAEGQKLRDTVRDRWLAVYDSLNPEQKEKARQFLKAGFDRMERKGGRHDRDDRRGRRGDRDDQRPRRGDAKGDMPPPKG